MARRPEQGASAVEYSLLAALVAAAVVTVVLSLGQSTQTSYQDSCNRISTALGSSC